MPHVPDTLAGWLAAWRPSRKGNPYLRLADGKLLVVFPQTCPAGFRGRVGATVVDRRWDTAEAAQRDLYDLVVSLTPRELDTLHGPVETRDDRQAADREPRREFTGEPPQDDGELLAELPRCDGREALRVTLKSFEGHPYIALRLWARDDRTGAWWPVRGKGCSIRMREAGRVAEALEKALATAAPAAAAPRQSDGRGDGGWTQALGGGPGPARAEFDDGARGE